MPAEAGFHIDLSLEGDVAPDDVERAQERLERVADVVPDPILHGQLRLSMAPSTPLAASRMPPAKVEGALDVNGRLVRAEVAAMTMREAVDRFADRLRSRLTQFVERRRTRRVAAQEADAARWREGDNATDRPQYADRPPGEREIVRRKSFAAPHSTPEEAAFDMETLDHDFFLFRNAATGEENVVHRGPDGGYELIQPTPERGDVDPGGSIRPSAQVPPRISVADAVTTLDVGNQPFVFFIDSDDGEGAVVYRRYDGHYGLITLEPAT